jgi:hypothetical protein
MTEYLKIAAVAIVVVAVTFRVTQVRAVVIGA